MYEITSLTPEFYHVSDDADMEKKFRFHPNISAKSMYIASDKSVALLEVEYRLECIFEDMLKDKLIFASTIKQFSIIKNDSKELSYTSEAVFTCVKDVEKEFNNFLSTKEHGITLIGLGIKPLTFQSWANKGPQNGDAHLNN